MRKFSISCFIFIALMLPSGHLHADGAVVDSTVIPFFTALQSGDINVIKSFIGGDMYQKMITAFEQDKEYGEFLKQRYDGAIFYPTVIKQWEGKMIVRVEVEFQGKEHSTFDLLVKKDTTATWQIIDQFVSRKNN